MAGGRPRPQVKGEGTGALTSAYAGGRRRGESAGALILMAKWGALGGGRLAAHQQRQPRGARWTWRRRAAGRPSGRSVRALQLPSKSNPYLRGGHGEAPRRRPSVAGAAAVCGWWRSRLPARFCENGAQSQGRRSDGAHPEKAGDAIRFQGGPRGLSPSAGGGVRALARAKAAWTSWAGLVGVAAAGSERSGNAAARAGRHLGVGNCRRCRTPLDNCVPGFLWEALLIGARKQGASGGWWVDPVFRVAGRRVESRLGGGYCCGHLISPRS